MYSYGSASLKRSWENAEQMRLFLITGHFLLVQTTCFLLFTENLLSEAGPALGSEDTTGKEQEPAKNKAGMWDRAAWAEVGDNSESEWTGSTLPGVG